MDTEPWGCPFTGWNYLFAVHFVHWGNESSVGQYSPVVCEMDKPKLHNWLHINTCMSSLREVEKDVFLFQLLDKGNESSIGQYSPVV